MINVIAAFTRHICKQKTIGLMRSNDNLEIWKAKLVEIWDVDIVRNDNSAVVDY